MRGRALVDVRGRLGFPLIAVAYRGGVALHVTRKNSRCRPAAGFTALIGRAVLNRVLLLSDVQARRGRGGPVAVVEAGSGGRLRAVLFTALARHVRAPAPRSGTR